MDLLALLGLSYVFRRLRPRERDHTPAVAPPSVGMPPHAIPAPTATTPAATAARPRNALLWRAARGLLLAGLLILLALMPWPTAWPTSAALAPAVQSWRLWVIANVDLLTVSLVVLAMMEPRLSRLLGAIWHIPRLIGLLAQLVWVRVRVSYWRYRNWQRVSTWAAWRSR